MPLRSERPLNTRRDIVKGMLVTPHKLCARGYFEQLQNSELEALRSISLEIIRNPDSFFSYEDISYCSANLQVVTETETLSAEGLDVSEFDDFVSALGKQWRHASITLFHGTKTRNLGLKLIGAHRGEQLSVSFDNIEGIAQVEALFREGCNTQAYVMRLANGLGLSDKPKKASRLYPRAA